MKTVPIETKTQDLLICKQTYKRNSNIQKDYQCEGVTLVAV